MICAGRDTHQSIDWKTSLKKKKRTFPRLPHSTCSTWETQTWRVTDAEVQNHPWGPAAGFLFLSVHLERFRRSGVLPGVHVSHFTRVRRALQGPDLWGWPVCSAAVCEFADHGERRGMLREGSGLLRFGYRARVWVERRYFMSRSQLVTPTCSSSSKSLSSSGEKRNAELWFQFELKVVKLHEERSDAFDFGSERVAFQSLS